MAAGAQDSCGPESLKLLSVPSCPYPNTHSLFSVKNHKVLLDRIKAVLKVVILLLVRKTYQ